MSSYKYDSNGHLSSAKINDDRDRTVSYVTDARGQVLSRKEVDNLSTGDPRQLSYYFDGLKVGEVSNNGPAELDYAVALNYRTANIPASSPWRYETHWSVADFDQSYDPINPTSRGSGPSGSYTVRDGDTLRSIAQMVWGDGAMWYLIADANGLNGTEMLVSGQSIAIPAKITNIHNNSETFRTYDPNKAIGDTSPVEPKPQKNGTCAMIGQIVVVFVAIGVTVLTQGAFASVLGPVLGAAAAGATASVVSQGVGVALGVQDKIDWKGVGIAAVTAGISKGADKFLQFGKIAGSATLADAVRGAGINAASQGVAVAVGLQKKFDWAGVASAAVVSGVSGAMSRALPGAAIYDAKGGLKHSASFANANLSDAAAALAGASARSLLTGTSFGDNLMRVLPDVIGSTIGNAVVGGIKARDDRKREIAAKEKHVAVVAHKEAVATKVKLAALAPPDMAQMVSPSYAANGLNFEVPRAQLAALAQGVPTGTATGPIDGVDPNALQFIPTAPDGTGNIVDDMISRRGDPALLDWVPAYIDHWKAPRVYEQWKEHLGSLPENLGRLFDLGEIVQAAAVAHPNHAGIQELIEIFHAEIRANYASTSSAIGAAASVIADAFSTVANAVIDDTVSKIEYVARVGVSLSLHGITTAAINSPFTSDTAAELLTEWRDGTGGIRYFPHDSAASRELFVGYTGDYYREVTRLGLQQLAEEGNGVIRDGQVITVNRVPDFNVAHGLYGARDGVGLGDVIGTFTWGVEAEARDGYVYFRGVNDMTLESLAGENLLRHGLVTNPTSGPFSTTTQIIEWRRAIPQSMQPRPGRRR